MILMVSGRTDIIKYYTPWFMNRYKAGFVDVRNPINPKLVSRIYFKNVDLIVFCTKDPRPIIPYLKTIKIPYLLQVTLTPYHNDIEINVKDKKEIIKAISSLSDIIGQDNIFVRYDPILLNFKYDVDYHIKALSKLLEILDGKVYRYIISFIDIYKNVKKHLNELKLEDFTPTNLRKLGKAINDLALKYQVNINTCGETNLEKYGFKSGECISIEDAYRLTAKLDYKKQTIRKNVNCSCLQTVDIGAYNTCLNLCKYCYANFKEEDIKRNYYKHDDMSSLLIGNLEADDIIKERYK